jgi:hypothetical protein
VNIVPFAARLEAAGLGIQGQSIFINQFPAETITGILLRERVAGAKLDPELPGYIKFQFQLIVRSNSYESGQALVTQAAKALQISNAQLDTLFINYCRPAISPVGYPISNGEQTEFNCNINVCCVDPTWQ